MSKEKTWQVTIVTKGQAGLVYYIEESNSARFEWEYGAYDIIAFVWGTLSENWDSTYPWAIGRRQDIMRRVAEEVIKQRARNCWADFDYDHTNIKIRKHTTTQ